MREPDGIRPMHVVVICLVAATVAGGSLLLSAAESTALVDGAIDWQVESPLRAVVQLLCLNYRLPTLHAGAIKNYLLGLGAGLTILTLAVAIIAGRRTDDVEAGTDEKDPASPVETGPLEIASKHKSHVAPLIAAQLLVGLYLLWSFASSRWSAAPELATGGSLLITVNFFWALGIGHGLNRPAARIAAWIVLVASTATAGVALWYYYGRNPTIRAKFPFGNPNFLSACLIPGALIAVSLAGERIHRLTRTRHAGSMAVAATAIAVTAVLMWAFFLTGSRGPAIGLAAGVLAMIFFALRGRARLVPVLVAVVMFASAWVYYRSMQNEPSPHGRSATIRFRTYVWGYAWRMFHERPLTGHGQGAFVLTGDSYAGSDVLNDPLVFEARIAHAHNEWLEVMADLGTVGVALLVAALAFTLRAGMLALKTSLPPPQRWVLIGLMGSLVSLIVEETSGVGLRVSGVPTLFFTVLGLIWALSNRGPMELTTYCSARTGRRVVSGIAGIAVGLAVMVVAQHDFAAARCAYRAGESLQDEDYESTIHWARAARGRLNPQRALENLARLSRAHSLVALKLQERAADREMRARQHDLPDARLLALADQDRNLSDDECKKGSRTLKKLVSWSPYFNHGQIEYELNLIQAANAAARNDREVHDQCISNAAAAIERELQRRPFDPSVTLQYLSVAGDAVDLKQMITVLARPLRHNRITVPYVDFLAGLSSDPGFDGDFGGIVQDTYKALGSQPLEGQEPSDDVLWAPEKLRLAATVYFRRGDYRAAREALESAARVYDSIASSAPIGAASCYAELADSQFFDKPEEPGLAIRSAEHAISVAPESLAGRRLRRSVLHRMVDYNLAGQNEEEAKRLLAESAPSPVTAEMIRSELGFRYRGLCESLLRRRMTEMLRQPANGLLPKLRHWAARAIELNPKDALALYLGADLALHGGDCAAAADLLQRAVDGGLAPDAAKQFIQAAREKRPDCKALEEVRIESIDRDGR